MEIPHGGAVQDIRLVPVDLCPTAAPHARVAGTTPIYIFGTLDSQRLLLVICYLLLYLYLYLHQHPWTIFLKHLLRLLRSWHELDTHNQVSRFPAPFIIHLDYQSNKLSDY